VLLQGAVRPGRARSLREHRTGSRSQPLALDDEREAVTCILALDQCIRYADTRMSLLGNGVRRESCAYTVSPFLELPSLRPAAMASAGGSNAYQLRNSGLAVQRDGPARDGQALRSRLLVRSWPIARTQGSGPAAETSVQGKPGDPTDKTLAQYVAGVDGAVELGAGSRRHRDVHVEEGRRRRPRSVG
jgi:hypothetical protein